MSAEVAALLEQLGGSAHRVRACREAARAIREHPRELAAVVAATPGRVDGVILHCHRPRARVGGLERRYARGMRCAALLVLVVAAHARADAPKLPAHVAPLFEKGRVWVYDTAITTWGPDDPKTGKPARKTDRDKVTCKVAEVVTRAGVAVSHVTCDKGIYKLKVAGSYAGTPAGLWRVGGDDVPADDDIKAARARARRRGRRHAGSG